MAGPNIQSAPKAYEAIFAAQGFGRVSSSADIAREAARLLADPLAAKMAGDAAARGAAGLSGAVARTVSALEALLDARA